MQGLSTGMMVMALRGSAGKPVYGTLIALLHEGVPVLGVIDQPITRERWLGITGQPTTLNGADGPAPARLMALSSCWQLLVALRCQTLNTGMVI